MNYWDVIEKAYKSVDIYNGPEAFFQGFRAQPAPVQHLLAAHWCQSEVCNGGFNQFFCNSTGVLAPEAVLGFRAIGMPEAADIVATAIAAFGPEYPRDREQRNAAMEKMPHQRNKSILGGSFRLVEVFDDLDKHFYGALTGFEPAADAYAMRHSGDSHI